MAQEESTRSSVFADIEEVSSNEEINKWARTARLWQETLKRQWTLLTDELSVKLSMLMVVFFVLVAILAPYIAPNPPLERQYQTADEILIAKWAEPSILGGNSEYILGTTAQGFDIFSQLIFGTRAALLVGLIAAVFTAGIGTMVGLVAGYYGGAVDDALMRLVDFLYGMPLLPTVIILVALLGPNLWNIILAVIILQWRATARVIRSQALSLRERPFVKAAQVAGASDWHIISRHLAPNVLPMSFLYGSFAIAWAILTEAGVSFIGLGDPNTVSWGTMLQAARAYSALSFGAWWWFVPPGVCIGLLVISGFLIGRGYEEITNPKLQ
ncbi:ABC transporter permease [Halogeometricum borinquense]|uniref:ABC transporter permease n=1 Tax=Halogeometricum borinquense TaxID=60847 RepID=A0A6C0ULY7_9EURY|nr:ABC transporter permease [Halogeometricum borinquense]QIB76210.1 ABC transporter permease [Halogeometricum borinquense]QIQ75351.1 ABC transporter permease [Halogeometricum borinquense]